MMAADNVRAAIKGVREDSLGTSEASECCSLKVLPCGLLLIVGFMAAHNITLYRAFHPLRVDARRADMNAYNDG